MTPDRLDHLLKCNTGMISVLMVKARRERRIDEAVRAVIWPRTMPCILERPGMYTWIQPTIAAAYREIVEREEREI